MHGFHNGTIVEPNACPVGIKIVEAESVGAAVDNAATLECPRHQRRASISHIVPVSLRGETFHLSMVTGRFRGLQRSRPAFFARVRDFVSASFQNCFSPITVTRIP